MEKNAKDIQRIAILGAESTGKTTLAQSLAKHFHTLWVPEYARAYMSEHPGDYTVEDIIQIQKHQLLEEERLSAHSNKFLFTDTEFIIAKVWCEDVFRFCPDWINEQLAEHRYDLYLLTANDLPWVADPVRVNPQRRDYFFKWYKSVLDENNLKYEIISGLYESRLISGINAVKNHFSLEDVNPEDSEVDV